MLWLCWLGDGSWTLPPRGLILCQKECQNGGGTGPHIGGGDNHVVDGFFVGIVVVGGRRVSLWGVDSFVGGGVVGRRGSTVIYELRLTINVVHNLLGKTNERQHTVSCVHAYWWGSMA